MKTLPELGVGKEDVVVVVMVVSPSPTVLEDHKKKDVWPRSMPTHFW